MKYRIRLQTSRMETKDHTIEVEADSIVEAYSKASKDFDPKVFQIKILSAEKRS